ERNPKLGAAVLATMSSTDPNVVEPQHQGAELIGLILIGIMEPLPADVAAGIRGVLSHVWYSALLTWVRRGQTDMAEVYAVLDEACHLLLDPRE
ncbi:MAG TPA: hypothetical protein VGR90_01905, partial [Acidimicrobiales bacterium]|nr:hypothetical protein [Acidimicrobiales bacterium]